MKHSKVLTLLCMALMATMPACTDGGDNPTPSKPPVEDPDDKEPEKPDDPEEQEISSELIENYFNAVLNGEPAEYTANNTLTIDQIDGMTSMVWDIWKRANDNLAEDKLPELSYIKANDKTGTWTMGGDAMDFSYGIKGTDIPEDGYPLFLMLHGSGDNNSEFAASRTIGLRCDDAPSVYFIPRSPYGGTGCRWYQPSRQKVWERLLRQAYLTGRFNPNRVYIFGISEGAYGSQRLASFYADYLAGAGPIAGGEVLYWAPPENCANIAFCLQTGSSDTMFGRDRLTQKANSIWDGLQAAHPGCYEHKIELQQGYGHACDYYVTTPYLKTFERNPYPKYVYWENFPAGNINGEGAAFRSGFYNLYVKERSTDDADDYVRSCYEMTIDGNTVNLNVRVVTVTPSEPTYISGYQIYLSVNKSFRRATSGRVVVYLNNELVDLSQPVTINVNGVQKFCGIVKPNLKYMVNSCAEYFDPMRLYPAAVEVTVE